MTLQVVYSVSAGVTSDISDRVFMASERLGLPPFSITQNAEEGSVANSQLVVDDPLSTLYLAGHRRVYFVETSAPVGQQVIGNCYVGNKTVSRGDWRVGPLARTFTVDLADANTLISRRLIVGSDGNRPAETDIQRLTWLLATTEANEFNGPATYINTSGPVAMDAVDYRGQSVTAILSDLSQASHKNWWVVYFESVGQFGLWYDSFNSAAYASAISLSNDEADIDDSTIFAYFPTATLTQDPSRVYSGTLIDFQPASTETTSWVYEQRVATGNAHVFRDVAYPSLNVKTETKARARANLYLDDSDEEDDVFRVSFVVPAAQVNALMHGHRIQIKGTHWGFSSGNSYTAFTQTRCLTRTVTQMSSTHYRIDAELSPLPVATAYMFGFLIQREVTSYGADIVPYGYSLPCPGTGSVVDSPWTYLGGGHVFPAVDNSPFDAAYLAIGPERASWVWGSAGLNGSARPTGQNMLVRGACGPPEILELLSVQTTGSPIAAPTAVAPADGLMFGLFSARRVGDPTNGPYTVLSPSGVTVLADTGAQANPAADSLQPRAWLGYLPVTAGQSVSFEVSADWGIEYWGCMVTFIPGGADLAIVEFNLSGLMGGYLCWEWTTDFATIDPGNC